MKLDHLHRVKFAPIGGINYQLYILPDSFIPDSVFFYEDGKVFYKSQAILRALISLGGIYKIFILLLIIPVRITDFFYDFVARNRQRKDCPYVYIKNDRMLD
jgi:predicted DCC family thiol-disulfide oxidoreductase YuxK